MTTEHSIQVGRILRVAQLTIAMFLVYGCADVGQNQAQSVGPSLPTATDCTAYEAAFELHLSPEAVNCADNLLTVTATGLPDLTSGSSEDVPMVTTPDLASTILYRQISEDCWEFEYQPVTGESEQTVEACRH